MYKYKITYKVDDGPITTKIVMAGSVSDAQSIIKNENYGHRIIFYGCGRC